MTTLLSYSKHSIFSPDNIKKLIEHCKNHELKMVDELENMM